MPKARPAAPAPLRSPEAAIFLASLALRWLHLALNHRDFWLAAPLVDDRIFLSWSDVILREGWLAPSLGTFCLNPAYPYFLSVAAPLIGRGFGAVFAFQHLLGAAAPVLLFRLCARLFDRRTAWVAAALGALYGPAYFYESRYLGEIFIYVFNLGFLACLVEGSVEGGLEAWWAAGGLCLGLSVIFRPTGLALLPLAAACELLRRRGGRLASARRLALFSLGFCLPLLPLQWRNRMIDPSAGWALTTGSAGINFFMGNNPESDGCDGPPSFVRFSPDQVCEDFSREAARRSGRTLSPAEVGRFWLQEGLSWFHDRPAEAWRLLLRKSAYFWNRCEPPDNFFMAVFERFSRLGPLPLPGWGAAAALGLAGMLWGLGRFRGLWLLYAYVAAYFAVNALFFVLSRYRFPAVAGLIPFAAFTLTRLEELARGRRWEKAALLGALLIPCLALTRLHLLVCEENPASSHYGMALVYGEHGLTDRAVEEYGLSLRADPGYTPSLLNMGLLAARRGDVAQARAYLERAAPLERDPGRLKQIRDTLAELKAGGFRPRKASSAS